MTTTPSPESPLVRPGDCLLYRGTGLVSHVIMWKTWSPVSHVEVALNEHYAISSRPERGVAIYPFTPQPWAVLRPVVTRPLDWGAAMRWFGTVLNEPYDYWGLLRFYNIGQLSDDKHHCAEICTRWYRRAGFMPFAEDYDPDKVSPGMYLSSPHFEHVLT